MISNIAVVGLTYSDTSCWKNVIPVLAYRLSEERHTSCQIFPDAGIPAYHARHTNCRVNDIGVRICQQPGIWRTSLDIPAWAYQLWEYRYTSFVVPVLWWRHSAGGWPRGTVSSHQMLDFPIWNGDISQETLWRINIYDYYYVEVSTGLPGRVMTSLDTICILTQCSKLSVLCITFQ